MSVRLRDPGGPWDSVRIDERWSDLDPSFMSDVIRRMLHAEDLLGQALRSGIFPKDIHSKIVDHVDWATNNTKFFKAVLNEDRYEEIKL